MDTRAQPIPRILALLFAAAAGTAVVYTQWTRAEEEEARRVSSKLESQAAEEWVLEEEPIPEVIASTTKFANSVDLLVTLAPAGPRVKSVSKGMESTPTFTDFLQMVDAATVVSADATLFSTSKSGDLIWTKPAGNAVNPAKHTIPILWPKLDPWGQPFGKIEWSVKCDHPKPPR